MRLLADIKATFDKRKLDGQEADKLASADLCDPLAADATGQWADYKHGKPIGQAQLANELKPFGISPGTVRIGKVTPKGYERTAFAEAWSRCLPAPEEASAAGGGGTEPQHRSRSSSSAIRLRPHRSGQAAFPHPALPGSDPHHPARGAHG